ncbi:MAG: hypothetical protein NTX17_05325 [Candidatus Eisenbacteria bacterium]|nr:hypothetical protein [Candidatus Eisenbacteria bacterium]
MTGKEIDRSKRKSRLALEHRHEPLLPQAAFVVRMVLHAAVAIGIVSAALVIGVFGYHFIAQLPWIDALVNASMILGGMGPVDALHTAGAKLFASFYALFAGIVFLLSVGILFAPIVHRFLHRFHIKL